MLPGQSRRNWSKRSVVFVNVNPVAFMLFVCVLEDILFLDGFLGISLRDLCTLMVLSSVVSRCA